MHTATQTVAEHLAVATLVAAGPLAVAEWFVALVPHLPEIVVVDVALIEIRANRGATRQRAIDTYRGGCNASRAVVERVAHLGFVTAQKAFTSVREVDSTLAAGASDKLHHLAELFVRES